ncbi:MAG: glycosyltransferase family 4 protein, partial [Desulfobacteraceae bacterium]|nr:glycosyltransferase family 4 protein [Desulfobacteraceae bacterium]
MKLCYLVHNQDGLFYRYKQYLPFFEKKGVDISIVPLKGGGFSRFNCIWKAGCADIVIVRRKLLQPWESMLLSIRACKVIFDFDDAILFKSSAPYYSFGRKIKFMAMIKSSDVIIAGNSYLKELAATYTDHDRIHILPTPLDLSKYREKDYTVKTSQVTLGWIGSKSTLRYLKELIPIFNRLGKKYSNIKLKIVANAFFDCDKLIIEKKEWKYDDEVDDLLSFDIGLMPLDETPWSKGKCSFKLIQYLAVGIPSVCSPVGMNKDVIANGKQGLWATSLEEWESQLSKLIEDTDLRKKMGTAAFDKAYLYDQKFVFEKFYKIICNTLE